MKAKVVYIKPDKAKRVNEILVAEKEFMENEKIRSSKCWNKALEKTCELYSTASFRMEMVFFPIL